MPEPVHPPLPASPHGGATARPFTGLDFSVNTNPFGPNPALLRALRDADHVHYPDPSYTALRERLAAWHGTSPECVVPAVGASELLHRLARAYLRPGEGVVSVHAPFGEFGRAARLAGARVSVVTAEEAPAVIRPGVRLVYVGCPHNPRGTRPGAGELAALLDACERADALLILDVAYSPFLALPDPPAHAHLLTLHSPGKAHGLVGARPAYALAGGPVAAALHNLAPAWAVPAGTAALLEALPGAQDFLERTRPQVAGLAAALAAGLAPFGRVEHHGTPFMTLEVGRGPWGAGGADFAAALLQRGFRVRDCASYGLPGRVRVSARAPRENARLLRAMGEIQE